MMEDTNLLQHYVSVLHLMVHKSSYVNYMKLQKPNLLQYLVTYIVMNLNYLVC